MSVSYYISQYGLKRPLLPRNLMYFLMHLLVFAIFESIEAQNMLNKAGN